jgi:hypothetical protein
VAVSGLTLPFLSEGDPEQSGEGSLDPLGLASLADRLADEIAPGITARMSRIRFVTAIGVGAVATETLSNVIAADGVSPACLAFEWHVVEALARDKYLPPQATLRVPGIEKARSAVARGVHMDAAGYLKVPKVFGFSGVYKRLARAMDVVDEQLLLAPSGDRLVRAWEEEQELPGFVDRERGTPGGRFVNQLESAVRDALGKGKVALPLNARLWPTLVRAIRPDTAGPRERQLVWELLTDHAEPVRRELVVAVSGLGLEGSEAEVLRALQPGASVGLLARLGAIDAYERVAECLSTSFDTLRRVSTARGATPVDLDELRQNAVVSQAASELPGAIDDAFERVEPLGLGAVLADAIGSFGGVTSPAKLAEALLAHHERIQEAKPPGKRPWFEQTTRGFVVRPLYRVGESRGIEGRYVHPYRVDAIRSFLSDLA